MRCSTDFYYARCFGTNPSPCSLFPDNPCYDPEVAVSRSLSLLFDTEYVSPELSRYLVKHGLLPDARMNSLKGPERGRQLMRENLDFFTRFYRRMRY